MIQETITWADQQFDPPRNSKAGCLRAQAEKLAFLAEIQRCRDAAEQEMIPDAGLSIPLPAE